MAGTIFWDVDTQIDFMLPDGKLYVPGAETILPTLALLYRWARQRGLRLWGSIDHHGPGDAELSTQPDFDTTYPPHCLAGSHGADKAVETRLADPLWVDSDLVAIDRVLAHRGEVVFRKQRFDVFSNPNTERVLAALRPDDIVVFGVAQDVCNRYAIEGMLARGHKVTAVRDAMRPIHADVGARLLEEWAGRGVRVVTSAQLMI